MTRFCTLFAFITSLGLLTCSAGCASTQGLEPSPVVATPSPQATQELTDIIASLLEDTGSEGREVTIVGYYRGWDLLGETDQSPPVTRSDWVIKDQSGALYVQMNNVEIEGLDQLAGSETLKPGDQGSIHHILRVTGIVRLTPEGQCYIEPERIELVK